MLSGGLHQHAKPGCDMQSLQFAYTGLGHWFVPVFKASCFVHAEIVTMPASSFRTVMCPSDFSKENRGAPTMGREVTQIIPPCGISEQPAHTADSQLDHRRICSALHPGLKTRRREEDPGASEAGKKGARAGDRHGPAKQGK